MKLLEYQAKALLREAGIPTPPGRVATTPEEAEAIAASLGGAVAVKAQVPVGGRAKAGGVQLAGSPAEAREKAAEVLSRSIQGIPVRRLLVEAAVPVVAEHYACVALDRGRRRFVLMVAREGGVDVEESAARSPSALVKHWIDPVDGLWPYQARAAVLEAGLDPSRVTALSQVLVRLARLASDRDALLAEINPLAVLGDGQLAALDAKVEIDDNARFRQPLLEDDPETGAEHPLERAARQAGLAYVKLEGEVGVIGNGAGLVMTTLDMIRREGGRPANFLDIGGGAREEAVRAAVQTVLADPQVRAVLINIFGGITRCDTVARGLLAALESSGGRGVPLVVRLAGTQAEEGLRILAGANLPRGLTLEVAEHFEEAAARAVARAREVAR